MRILYLSLTVLLILALFCGCSLWQTPKSYNQLEFETDLEWSKPNIQSMELDNGIRCFLLPKHELPLVKVVVKIRAGGFQEPKHKVGLAEILSKAMRNGGSEQYPGSELNRLLENKAAKMEISFDFISGRAFLDVLQEDVYDLLPVFADVLNNPALPTEKIHLAKKQMQTQIARRNENQRDIARREFKRLLYGRDSVYGRQPEYKSVKAVHRSDLVRFQRQAFCGENLIVGVSGDFDPEKMKAKLRQVLSVFPKGEKNEIQLPSPNGESRDKIYFAHKPGVNQSYIMIGHMGGRRQNPDYAAIQVLNNILSGGFSGRLFQKIRTEKGLAYNVFGRYSCRYFYPGMFFVGMKTKSQRTKEALFAVEHELISLAAQGASSSEVETAKDLFLNSLIFRYDSNLEVLKRRMFYEYRDMHEESFSKLIQEIKEVDVREVNKAAQEYLRPEALQVVIVGDRQELQAQLEQLGEVKEIDISIPSGE